MDNRRPGDTEAKSEFLTQLSCPYWGQRRTKREWWAESQMNERWIFSRREWPATSHAAGKLGTHRWTEQHADLDRNFFSGWSGSKENNRLRTVDIKWRQFLKVCQPLVITPGEFWRKIYDHGPVLFEVWVYVLSRPCRVKVICDLIVQESCCLESLHFLQRKFLLFVLSNKVHGGLQCKTA